MNFAGIKGGQFWDFYGKTVRPLNVIGKIPVCGRKGRPKGKNIFPGGLAFCLPTLNPVRVRVYGKIGAENFPNRVH
jgi:hypothetical protein